MKQAYNTSSYAKTGTGNLNFSPPGTDLFDNRATASSENYFITKTYEFIDVVPVSIRPATQESIDALSPEAVQYIRDELNSKLLEYLMNKAIIDTARDL